MDDLYFFAIGVLLPAMVYTVGICIFCLYRLLSSARNRHVHDDDESRDAHNDDEYIVITIKELTGLDPSVIRSIPVVDFNSQDFKDDVACVVCLSDLADGDKTKALPSCDHLFHEECIDTWLGSNSTCPICRMEVQVTRVPQLDEQDYHADHDESLIESYDLNTDSSFSQDVRITDEANEVPIDLTAVVVDIPKHIRSLSA